MITMRVDVDIDRLFEEQNALREKLREVEERIRVAQTFDNPTTLPSYFCNTPERDYREVHKTVYVEVNNEG